MDKGVLLCPKILKDSQKLPASDHMINTQRLHNQIAISGDMIDVQACGS